MANKKTFKVFASTPVTTVPPCTVTHTCENPVSHKLPPPYVTHTHTPRHRRREQLLCSFAATPTTATLMYVYIIYSARVLSSSSVHNDVTFTSESAVPAGLLRQAPPILCMCSLLIIMANYRMQYAWLHIPCNITTL
ncbi:hypothetical protein T492DRAFT_979435 [Pavlovales sp. CCMP2436]|nr:hypothetical protein T492DRAFT_979435 [Pavlovales sp. CCMP2436]